MLYQDKAVLLHWVDAWQRKKQQDIFGSPTHLFFIVTCAPLSVTSAGNFLRESSSKACSARIAIAMPTRSVWIRYQKTVLVSLFLAVFVFSEIILKLIHILYIFHHIVLVKEMKQFESWLWQKYKTCSIGAI
jgi:hypothetical protein